MHPTTPELHRNIEPLACLVGEWQGVGVGHYPTIPDFAYVEHVTFSHVGKPFLSYVQRTRDAETGLPLHAESGYLRPGPRRHSLELVIAQPSGIVEIHAGEWSSDGGRFEISLTSELVATTLTAKDVTAARRSWVIEDGQLVCDVSMAAVGQALQHHLHATLSPATPT